MAATPNTEVFPDAAYVIALAQATDAHHSPAVEMSRQLAERRVQIVTTDAVLLEIGNALAKVKSREGAIRFITHLQNSPAVEIVPLTKDLLAVGLAAEIAAYRGHAPGLRAVPAMAADLAVWLLVYVMTSPDGVPSEYRPIAATTITVLCLALFAIYGGGFGLRSFGLRHRPTVFEIAQAVVAFVLATFGTLRASPGSA